MIYNERVINKEHDMNNEESYNFDTTEKLRRMKVQIKALRLAMSHFENLGLPCANGGSYAWTEFRDELRDLKDEYRYLTYEKNHGSLAAEMVVGSYPGF